MEELGSININGKMIDIENTSIDELNNCLKSLKNAKEAKKEELNNFLNSLYN